MKFELRNGLAVVREVRGVVPAHGVGVSLHEVVGELGLARSEEGEEDFVAKEVLLLEDLRVDVGGAQSADAGAKVVAYSFYGL